MQSQKIAVISCWNVEGVLQSPICITWLLNVPSTVANAVLWTCSGTMCICSYASDILSFDRYATLAISLWMISWSGNGVTSLTMLLFCSHKSKTVCNLLFFFGMQSIGTTWCATAGIHHCAVVYLSIFWESSSWKCSGHFGRWQWIHFLGSIRLILWLTSWIGGSFSGIPLTRSVILLSQLLQSWGISSSLRTTSWLRAALRCS